jgi:hypothetical protein
MAKKPRKPRGPKQPEFDFGKAKKAKTKGMDDVLRGEEVFKVKVAQMIDNLAHDWEGIYEDIRALYKGPPHPHHPNCWGATCNAAVKRGTLVKTGEMRPPTAIKSHCRPTHVYRRR